MYFSVQNVLNFFPVKHRARYNLMILGTPWLYMYLFKNLITFVPEALFIISANGYFEYLSTLVMKYCSIPFSLSIGPPKSICISSESLILSSYQFPSRLCTRWLLPVYPGGYMATNYSALVKALRNSQDELSVYPPTRHPFLLLVSLFFLLGRHMRASH